MEPELAAELAAHDEAVAIAMEEKRRAAMFEKANVQKDVPFKIGEVVFEQEQPGAARVERGGAHHLRAASTMNLCVRPVGHARVLRGLRSMWIATPRTSFLALSPHVAL